MSRTEGGDQTRISDFVPTPMTRHLVLLGHLSPPSWSDPLPSPPVPCRKGVLGPLRRVTLSQATEQPDCLHPRFLARSLRTQKALEQRRSADPWVSPICPPHPHLHRVCQVVRSRWRTLRQKRGGWVYLRGVPIHDKGDEHESCLCAVGLCLPDPNLPLWPPPSQQAAQTILVPDHDPTAL